MNDTNLWLSSPISGHYPLNNLNNDTTFFYSVLCYKRSHEGMLYIKTQFLYVILFWKYTLSQKQSLPNLLTTLSQHILKHKQNLINPATFQNLYFLTQASILMNSYWTTIKLV